MKILFAGDTHGDPMHIRHLTAVAKRQDCDRIFVLGDFGYWEHTKDGVTFLDAVSKHAIAQGIPVYFLDGNHDKSSLLVQRYGNERNGEGFMTVRGRLFYAHRGHAWTWGERTFASFGGAYSTDKAWRVRDEAKKWRINSDGLRVPTGAGTLWFPEEEMTDDEAVTAGNHARNYLDHQGVDRLDVMLAHDKPKWSNPEWNRKAYPECAPNQLRLQRIVNQLRPQTYLHGHLHFRYHDVIGHPVFVETTDVYGVHCDPSAADNHPNQRYTRELSWTVYDTEKGAVEWPTNR